MLATNNGSLLRLDQSAAVVSRDLVCALFAQCVLVSRPGGDTGAVVVGFVAPVDRGEVGAGVSPDVGVGAVDGGSEVSPDSR